MDHGHHLCVVALRFPVFDGDQGLVSRHVLAWSLSNSLEMAFCRETLVRGRWRVSTPIKMFRSRVVRYRGVWIRRRWPSAWPVGAGRWTTCLVTLVGVPEVRRNEFARLDDRGGQSCRLGPVLRVLRPGKAARRSAPVSSPTLLSEPV